MTQYLLSVYMTEADETMSEDEIQRTYQAVDDFNEKVKSAGAWVFAGGLEPIESGTVSIPRPVGMVFQFHHLFANMSAHRNVWLAPVHVLKQPRAAAEQRAQELLASLGVGDRALAMPHELSGGEAQRVAIARALAIEPHILLMDEPTASLDAARRGDLAATLRQLAEEGRTIIIATHDAEFARACAHRALTVEGGRVHVVS